MATDSFAIDTQQFYANNYGFSVNEDFESGNANTTAYHFTSGDISKDIMFSIAKTNSHTNMFASYGSFVDNTFVIGSETLNTNFEFRTGLGIADLVDLSGGTLLFKIGKTGEIYAPLLSNTVLNGEDANLIIFDPSDGKLQYGNIGLKHLNDISNSITPVNKDVLYYLDGMWTNKQLEYTDITGTVPFILNDLSDVTITTPADNQVLQYNESLGIWENRTNLTMYGNIDMSENRIFFTDGKIKIGNGAGVDQSANTIAIGDVAGSSGQNIGAIAIGWFSGKSGSFRQGESSIAIGTGAAGSADSQYMYDYTIAIGYLAGHKDASNNTIAIGNQAGYNYQGENAISMGYQAGYISQGTNSIAIGYQAGYLNQHVNTVVINAADNTALNSDASNALYIAPIRDATQSNILGYNTSSKEITYYSTSSLTSNITLNDLSDVTITTPADNQVLQYSMATNQWVNNTDISLNGVLDVSSNISTINGQFLAQNGTSSSPTYSFTNSQNTGIYYDNSGIRFTIEGAPKISIDKPSGSLIIYDSSSNTLTDSSTNFILGSNNTLSRGKTQ